MGGFANRLPDTGSPRSQVLMHSAGPESLDGVLSNDSWQQPAVDQKCSGVLAASLVARMLSSMVKRTELILAAACVNEKLCLQVCGNSAAAAALSAWLENWQPAPLSRAKRKRERPDDSLQQEEELAWSDVRLFEWDHCL